jgi:hypothetical protein
MPDLLKKIMDNAKYFLVKSKGLTKQLTSYMAALKLFNFENGKLKRKQEAFHSKLFGKENLPDPWTLIDELKISQSFYKEED